MKPVKVFNPVTLDRSRHGKKFCRQVAFPQQEQQFGADTLRPARPAPVRKEVGIRAIGLGGVLEVANPKIPLLS